MSADVPLVRVVVLNWNAAWLTARCVRSLQASTYPADRLEIVIVDNASIDGSLERLRNDLQGVTFLENPTNLGFAEGNNRALRGVDAPFVALVNNDAVVEPGWLEPLVEALADEPRAGAAVPKMLLETPFAEVRLSGDGTIERITLDGVDVTRRCRYEGTLDRAHPTLPLVIDRTVDQWATVHVPVAGEGSHHHLTITWQDGSTTDADLGRARTRRINSLGTELTPWTEGTERWFGEVDRPHLGRHATWGFSGGGVLLRTQMLREVGVFDPKYFAYYEDTDLAWRARRHGWGVVCAPDAVVHHLHGGSAGPEAQGFFFLNYRNWLLTVLRNGSPAQWFRAVATARKLSWPAFRRNVFGPLRRGNRPDLRITAAWARVLAGLLPLVPHALLGRRRGAVVGATPVDSVLSRLMPSTPPRPPRPRAGGPVVCYVDVTETLRSGWRAGIQRVVCELFRELPAADTDVEMVPVCWSKVHRSFRRLDAAEYASMLAPTAAQQPAGPVPGASLQRKVLALVMHRSGAAPLVHRWRRYRELAAVPRHHRQLLLDRFEPGTVFLDLDATWNPTTLERSTLLADLRAGGVATVAVQYDLVPDAHPEWFIPQMVDVFMAHVDAHLDAGSTFLSISHDTADALTAYAVRTGRPAPTGEVVPMGVTPLPPTDGGGDVPDAPYFLIVGTVEPRKNHAVVLDAFEKLRTEHPEARLVVAGRPGWTNTEVIDRLRSGPDGVDWRTGTSDAELDALYRGAHAVVVASITEGFGLPVIEALQRSVPVLSSDGGALPEAGGDLVEYFDPSSATELHALLLRHLDDPAHHAAQRTLAASFEPTPWSTSAAAVAAAVRRARETHR